MRVLRFDQRNLRLLAILLLGFVANGVAQRECEPYSGGGTLRIEGIGTAEFAQVTAEGGRERLTLSAGVCVTFEGTTAAVLRAEELELTRGDPWDLRASRVSLELPELRLTGEGMRLAGDRLLFERATLEGEALVGTAVRLEVAWKTGEWSAEEVRFATPVGWWDAARARTVGGEVRFEAVWFSSCDCPPGLAPARIEAAFVEIGLDPLSLTIGEGIWVSSLGRASLPARFRLDPEAWARWLGEIQVTPAGGLSSTWRPRTVAPGVSLGGALASGWPTGDRALALDLQAASDDRTVRLQARDDRLRVDWNDRVPLGDLWFVSIGQRLEFGAWPTNVRDSYLTLSRAWSGRAPPPLSEVTGRVNLGVAVTATGAAGGTSVGSRATLDSHWLLRGVPVAGTTPRLAAAAGVGLYPEAISDRGVAATQWWGEVRPGLEWRGGGTSVSFDHRGRWVAGASPFGVAVDRLLPLQETNLNLRSRHAWTDGSLDARLAVAVNWDRDPTGGDVRFRITTLNPTIALSSTLSAGLLRGAIEGELAGWTQTDGSLPKRSLTASLRLDADASWGALGLSVRGEAGKPATRSLTLTVGGQPSEFRWSVALAGDPWALTPLETLRFQGELGLERDDLSAGIAVTWLPWSPESAANGLMVRARLPWIGGAFAVRPSFEVDASGWVRGDDWRSVWRAYGLEFLWETRLGSIEATVEQRQDQGARVRVGVSLPNRPVELKSVLASGGVPLRTP